MSKHNKFVLPGGVTTPEAMAAYEAERVSMAAMKRQYAGLGAMFSTFTADPPPPYTLFGLTRSAEPNTAGCNTRAEAYESSELRDKCGALARENRDLLAENARLRRRIEDMERKGKKR